MPDPLRRDEPTGYFRAVAVDFDGTLAEGGRPDPGVLEALAEVRVRGVRVVLATGRILAELRTTSRIATSTSTPWWGRTARWSRARRGRGCSRRRSRGSWRQRSRCGV